MSEVDVPGDGARLSGGGEVEARMRAFDWATTPLGSPEGWPQNLKEAIASHISAATGNVPGHEDGRRSAAAPPVEEALRESTRDCGPSSKRRRSPSHSLDDSAKSCCATPRFDQLWGRPAHVTTAPTFSDVYEGYHLDGRRIASEEWPGARALLEGETIENDVYEIVQAIEDRRRHDLPRDGGNSGRAGDGDDPDRDDVAPGRHRGVDRGGQHGRAARRDSLLDSFPRRLASSISSSMTRLDPGRTGKSMPAARGTKQATRRASRPRHSRR